MRAVVATFLGAVALAVVSAQAAPTPAPPKVTAVELGAAPPSELVRQGCVGLAPRRMAGSLGLLALGALLP